MSLKELTIEQQLKVMELAKQFDPHGCGHEEFKKIVNNICSVLVRPVTELPVN